MVENPLRVKIHPSCCFISQKNYYQSRKFITQKTQLDTTSREVSFSTHDFADNHQQKASTTNKPHSTTTILWRKLLPILISLESTNSSPLCGSHFQIFQKNIKLLKMNITTTISSKNIIKTPKTVPQFASEPQLVNKPLNHSLQNNITATTNLITNLSTTYINTNKKFPFQSQMHQSSKEGATLSCFSFPQ